MQLNNHMDQGAPGQEATAFPISDLLAMLNRQKRLIVGITVALTGAAVVVLKTLPNNYTAFSTVLIDSREKTVTNIGRVVDGIRLDTPAMESQVEIVASRAVALAVIKKLGLRHDPEFTGAETPNELATTDRGTAELANTELANTGHARANPAGAGHPGTSAPGIGDRDYVLAAFRSSMDVRRVRNSNVIEISFTTRSPSKSAAIANAIVAAHIDLELKQKIGQSETASRFLADKLDGLREKLTRAEQNVQKFRAQNNLFDADGRPLSEKQLARLMEQTVLARNNTAEAHSRYEQVATMMRSGKPKGAIADVLKSHTVRMLKDQHARLAGHAAELAVKYGSRHPSMQKANAELRDIERQINREVDQILFNLKNEYDVARAREVKLATNLSDLETRHGRLGQTSVQLRELQREADATRQLYEAILSRFKQTTETQTMQLPDSRVVEVASVPLLPSSPKRKKLSILSGVAALVIALGLALIIELRRSGFSIGRKEQPQPDIEMIATLPLVEAAGLRDDDPMGAMRLMISQPDSAFAESVRAIGYLLDDGRSAEAIGPGKSNTTELENTRLGSGAGSGSGSGEISESGAAAAMANVVLVVSSLPREGRTIVASNLAHSYALNGAATLLIDADLRKSGLSGLLAPGAHAGLSDCLAANVPAQVAILRDASTGLNFLPARSNRTAHNNPAQLLSLPQMGKTMAQLRTAFDVIIIDCPPVLPVVDARLLADHADQILFVMAWQRTPKELAKRALTLFGNNAQKITSIVANRMALAGPGWNSAATTNQSHAPYAQPGTAQPSTAQPSQRAA